MEVTDAELNQETLNAATEEHITESKPKKATRAKAAKKPKKTAKKAAIELSSESDETDFHDMDVDYDPEVTMAAMGPPRGTEAGPQTRTRSRSASNKKTKKN